MFWFAICAPAICQIGSPANRAVYRAELERERQAEISMQIELAAEAADNARREAIRNEIIKIRTTVATMPWRLIDAETQHVSVAWCGFSGKILQTVKGKGVLIEGEYNSIYPENTISYHGDFFVKNYPYQAADGDSVPNFLAALPTDVYSYRTVLGSDRTVRCLDFGIPCGIPEWAMPRPDPNAAKEKAEQEEAAKERILMANEKAAAEGDPYGLLRMGERYRDGDGVQKDLGKARDYLIRAAEAGDPTATEELSKLPSSAAN